VVCTRRVYRPLRTRFWRGVHWGELDWRRACGACSEQCQGDRHGYLALQTPRTGARRDGGDCPCGCAGGSGGVVRDADYGVYDTQDVVCACEGGVDCCVDAEVGGVVGEEGVGWGSGGEEGCVGDEGEDEDEGEVAVMLRIEVFDTTTYYSYSYRAFFFVFMI